MRRAAIRLTPITAGLALAACGGGGSATTGHRGGAPPSHLRPSHLYRVTLSGAAASPRGAPQGTGVAVIALHGSSLLCWRFAHLHGFTHATVAHIHSGPKGRQGKVVVPLSTGTRLHHQGCVRARPSLTGRIVRDPKRYYVNIDSVRYPQGAVRGQL